MVAAEPTEEAPTVAPAATGTQPDATGAVIAVPKWVNPLLDEASARPAQLLPIPPPPLQFLRVLYIFAGARRRSDILECLTSLCTSQGVELSMTELDTCRDPLHDVLVESVQKALLTRLENPEFDVLIVTPPCSSWSRALFNRKPGPRPVRDRRHPWGYPWLQKKDFARCHNGNIFVRFSLQACHAAFSCGCKFLLEHPEDLGVTRDGFSPASIFNLSEMSELITETSACTSAFYQCLLGASSCKPTRIVTTLPGMQLFPKSGLPTFHKDGRYSGPLPDKCGSLTKHVALSGAVDGVF